MHHVVVLIGNYGPHWRHLPVIARCDGVLYVFVDHRTDPQTRQDAIRSVMPMSEVESWEAFVTSPPPGACAEGYHAWQTVDTEGVICRGCHRFVSMEEPFPVDPVAIVRAR